MVDPPDATSVRVLAVADTDSYLKWSAATLAALPPTWQTRQVLLANPVAPSAAQIAAAAQAPVPTLTLGTLLRQVRRHRPDVVLLACTGPVVAVLTACAVLSRGRRRPVLVTGLPGVHDPPTARAVRSRAGCDLFLAHSHAEVQGVTALAEAHAPGLQVALARLPFLPPADAIAGLTAGDGVAGDGVAGDAVDGRTQVVFAAQARVPGRRAEREAVLRGLAALCPAGTAVVKLRAERGEAQTHAEPWPYPLLWRDLVARGEVQPGAVQFRSGSMADVLDRARALVTVSSTAALEAIGRGLPVAVLTDFGVSPDLLNLVFSGSGCLATLADVRAGRIGRADPRWAEQHYFHPQEHDDWELRLRELVEQRATAGLARRPVRAQGRTSWRRRLRLLLPPGALRRAAGLRLRASRVGTSAVRPGEARPGRAEPGAPSC